MRPCPMCCQTRLQASVTCAASVGCHRAMSLTAACGQLKPSPLLYIRSLSEGTCLPIAICFGGVLAGVVAWRCGVAELLGWGMKCSLSCQNAKRDQESLCKRTVVLDCCAVLASCSKRVSSAVRGALSCSLQAPMHAKQLYQVCSTASAASTASIASA